MKKILLLLMVILLALGGIYLKSIDFLGYEEVSGENLEEIVDTPLPVPEVPEEEPVTKSISILAVGDIMFHMPQISSAKLNNGSYDFNPPFEYVKKYIMEADIALGNLETVTAGNNKGFSGFPRFNSPVETVTALKETGFDILSTANNHSLDRGKTGIITTIENIENNGLKNIGTYIDKEKALLIEEIEEIKIGFLSYTFGMNGLDSLLTSDELAFMIDTIDEKTIEEDIKALKESQADLILAYIHWGNEYQNKPHIYQEILGRKMIEWGANIILGSHPHVIQRYEMIEYEGKQNYIIYSMGNFYSNQRYETMGNSYTEDGVMVKLIIEKNFDTGDVKIKEVIHMPTWVYRYKENNRIEYAILPIEDIFNGNLAIELPDTVMGRLNKSYSDTMNTLIGNN